MSFVISLSLGVKSGPKIGKKSNTVVRNVEDQKTMQNKINLVFPHQLFADSPLLNNGLPIYLIEETLFFKQYHFHKQKIAFHRATMKSYEAYLKEKGHEVHYIDAQSPHSDVRKFLSLNKDLEEIHLIDPTDDWLEQRVSKFEGKLTMHSSPLFLNTKEDNAKFFRKDKKSFFQTTFYKQQRNRLGILLNADQSPVGGKWSFDIENRKKYPKNKEAPKVDLPSESPTWTEATQYVESNFEDSPGRIDQRIYPINYSEVQSWLQQFLEVRFHDFGTYEDAMVEDEIILNHSLLSPLMNVGLITPKAILDKAIEYAENNEIPINSTEGFVRQIIGWREFIRGMYEVNGSDARNKNYFKFNRKIPQSFYTGNTGIIPIDKVIHRVLKTGYCHHIERLMILGNFMILCEFDPDEVYRWFMELFIDSYDWVMVPNVYGMSQFADGGSFATKPYISGSNYIKKMSNFPNGDWQQIWDGLFWRFMNEYRETFAKNPRMGMLLNTLDKMPEEKRENHLSKAESFLQSL